MLTYLKTTVALVLVLLAAIASFTRWMDPYQIFSAPDAHTGLEVNQRYWKTLRILESAPPYTGFVLGDSRAAQLPASALNHDDVFFFNYATPSETIDESLQKLRFLLAQPDPPKEIVLFARLGSSRPHQPLTVPNDLARLDHPAVSGISRLDFFARFLFSQAVLDACIRDAPPPAREHSIAYASDGTLCYRWLLTAVELAAALASPPTTPSADALANELTTHRLFAEELARHHLRVVLVVPPSMQAATPPQIPSQEFSSYLQTLERLYQVPPILCAAPAIMQDAAFWNDSTHASKLALSRFILPRIQSALNTVTKN
jgi:hypothetical protein